MTVDELVQNQGAWHKRCYVKFNKKKLERAIKKRVRDDDLEHNNSGKKQPQQRQSIDRMACLFCHQGGGQLHEFRSLEANDS